MPAVRRKLIFSEVGLQSSFIANFDREDLVHIPKSPVCRFLSMVPVKGLWLEFIPLCKV